VRTGEEVARTAASPSVPAPPTGRRREIVDAALSILEGEGGSALTMRRLAAAVGIKASSLYKHFPDKEAVEMELIAVGFSDVAERFEEAVRRDRRRPLRAVAATYRAFAHDRPHLYRLMNGRPLQRERLPEGLEARAAAPLLHATGSRELARAAWGMAHGLVMLELNGRFPPDADVDAAWAAGVAAMERAAAG
jgi:AcrR family transcriptional regulator